MTEVVVTPPSAALGQEGLSDFLGLNDPDGLEEGLNNDAQTVPLLACLMFFSLLFWACGFWRKTTEEVPSHHVPSGLCALNLTPHLLP